MKKARVWLATGLLWSGAVLATPSFPVQVSGAVSQPGTHTLEVNTRLDALLERVRPTTGAYPIAGSVLRDSERFAQQRHKAGVLHDLDVLINREGDAWSPIREWVATLPVTGRIPVNADIRRLARSSTDNLTLQPGDQLLVPVRPTTIKVVGAVSEPCTLAFQPLVELDHYLDKCTRLPGANRDWVWLVQPDGRIHRRPIALWNTDNSLVHAAPGAVLVVGIADRMLGHDLAALNDELAVMAATQLLPDPS